MSDMSVPSGGPINNFVHSSNIPQSSAELPNYSQPILNPIAVPRNSNIAPQSGNATTDASATKIPSLQSNMFKMQRNKSKTSI